MFSATTAVLLLTLSGALSEVSNYEGPLLSTFREVQQGFRQDGNGVYRFFFTLPQQERHEERDSEGKVTGNFAFVDKVGEEVSVKYDADEKGFQPESDALPQVPEETNDVQRARDEFLDFYRQTVQYLKGFDSDEDSDSSSEESYEDGEYDNESSEEESEEEEEEEEKEEEEKVRAEEAPRGQLRAARQPHRNNERRTPSVYFIPRI